MEKKIRRMRKNLLGMELGAGGIKMVVGDFIKEGFVVKHALSNPLPDSICSQGEIRDVDTVSNIIKQTIKKNRIKAKACFCCVNSGNIITREVTVPAQNREHIHEVARYEVEQYLPIELENYAVQAIVLRELEIEGKPFAEMMVTAFPKDLIEQLHKVIQKSGLTPVVLDTQSNAFAKLIENQWKVNGNYYYKESSCAFVDMGYDSIKIQIFRHGKFAFSQVIPYGGRDLDINISRFMDVSIEEAVRMKMQIKNMNYTVDEMSDEAKLINVIKSTMNNWFEEINKIFRYSRSRSTNSQNVEYIYIYGGLSNIPGICDFIESQFKVPTEKIFKISTIETPANVDISDILNTLGVFYRR